MLSEINGLEQGSEEWVLFRDKGVGSSDVAAVMGRSRYKTPYEVYLDKIGEGEKFEGNYYTRRGQMYEPIARQHLENELDCTFPDRCFINKEKPWYRVSLDGWNECAIAEFKCRSEKNYLKFEETKEVPEEAMLQIQYQMLVANTGICYYCEYSIEQDKISYVEVKADEQLQREIQEAVDEFWNMVETRTPPPKTANDESTTMEEVKPLEAQGFQEIMQEWIEANNRLELAKNDVAVLRAVLDIRFEAMGVPKLDCMGYEMRSKTRKGKVQYKKIPELQGVDLEEYRGESTTYTEIKRLS